VIPSRQQLGLGFGTHKHLERGEAPPPIVDELITKTYHAIVEPGR
jgi:hypothetical protein